MKGKAVPGCTIVPAGFGIRWIEKVAGFLCVEVNSGFHMHIQSYRFGPIKCINQKWQVFFAVSRIIATSPKLKEFSRLLKVAAKTRLLWRYRYTIWRHIFVYWIFIESSVILEKKLMVGGGSNCTVSYIYIYIYIRFGEYSASWWCPGISFTFKFIFFTFQLKNVKKWFFQLLARSWFWWRLFYSKFNWKKF